MMPSGRCSSAGPLRVRRISAAHNAAYLPTYRSTRNIARDFQLKSPVPPVSAQPGGSSQLPSVAWRISTSRAIRPHGRRRRLDAASPNRGRLDPAALEFREQHHKSLSLSGRQPSQLLIQHFIANRLTHHHRDDVGLLWRVETKKIRLANLDPQYPINARVDLVRRRPNRPHLARVRGIWLLVPSQLRINPAASIFSRSLCSVRSFSTSLAGIRLNARLNALNAPIEVNPSCRPISTQLRPRRKVGGPAVRASSHT